MKTTTRIRRPLAAFALAAALPAAHAIDTRIEGLPAGLTVFANALHFRCNGPSGVAQGVQVALVPLTELTTTSWETAPALGGGLMLVQRTRTAYVGQMSLPALPGSGCSFGTAVNFNVGVVGEGNIGMTTRWGLIQTSQSPFTVTQLRTTMEARTDSLTQLVSANGTTTNTGTPTAATRGQFQRWISSYRDSMGESSVSDPALDFLVPSNFPLPGALASIARISVDGDGKVCVRASTGTVCRTRAQGGTVVNGNLEVDVAGTRHSALSTSASTQWQFRFSAGFQAGNITVRTSADDVDTLDYLVDSVPTSLNLLPWKALSVPLLIN